ncbi:OLC1v1035528C1 [Oldenlandia corymbosa var. corymbosa]|uniref:OLC1v1035528C1 n=1 Tax=Oldenlandia corymbosa var. corymbosa TaxID=529605 RepID=A0AAV1CT93_OLDCO|nr:OLC1v1035528C1 [Oldenlandia corymbosa var. corymbosa]
MVIVHPDTDFLEDIAGNVKEYVLKELNIKSLVPCNDALKYASLRASVLNVLGKRLGRSMEGVKEAVKALSTEDVLASEKSGEMVLASCSVKFSQVKITRVFKRPDHMNEGEMDAAGDGDVTVILRLRG